MLPKKDIHMGADNYAKFLSSINSRKVTPKEAGWLNSSSAVYYDTPYLKGYVTGDFNQFHGDIVRGDRLTGNTAKQYAKILAESGKKFLTTYELDDILYDKMFSDAAVSPEEASEAGTELSRYGRQQRKSSSRRPKSSRKSRSPSATSIRGVR